MFKFYDKGAVGSAYSKSSSSVSSKFEDSANPVPQHGNGISFVKPTALGMLEGLLSTNERALRVLYRDMYRHDPIVGATIDMLSNLPFGSFSLSGVPSAEMLEVYLRTCESLRLQTLLPALTTDYNVDGQFLGILNYDPSDKIFDSISPQNIDNAELEFVPLFGATPLVTLKFPPEYQRLFSKTTDPRVQKALRWIPQKMQNAIKNGRLEVATENTLYVPRRSFSYSLQGTSILQRLLPIFILEKSLLRGTIELSYRRQRGILHIIAGDEEWTATQDDLDKIAMMFTEADRDPVGAVLATRPGIMVNEVQTGGDFWRHDSVSSQFETTKLRALGVGDSFLSSETTVQGAENSLNVFLQNLKSFRSQVTSDVLYNKVFAMVAATNGFVKDDDNYQVMGKIYEENGKYFAYSNENRIKDEDVDPSRYYIPTVTWHNTLSTSQSGAEYLSTLQTLSQAGVPVPIRMMAAAGGISLQDLINGQEEDISIRKSLKDYMDQIRKLSPSPEEGQGGSDFGSVIETLENTLIPHKSPLSRDFGELNEILTPSLDGRGRRQVKSPKFQKEQDEKMNRIIAEAATRIAR